MNKKLFALGLVLALAGADQAQAQASLIANGVVAAFNLGRMAARKKEAAIDWLEAEMSPQPVQLRWPR